jgi:hypothetical protein
MTPLVGGRRVFRSSVLSQKVAPSAFQTG